MLPFSCHENKIPLIIILFFTLRRTGQARHDISEVKVFAVKPSDPSLIPGTYMVDRDDLFL